MRHLRDRLKFMESAPKYGARAALWLILAVTAHLISCADSLAPPDEPDGPLAIGGFGSNNPNDTAVGALLGPSGFTGCSVAFISERFGITAARCVAPRRDALQRGTRPPRDAN